MGGQATVDPEDCQLPHIVRSHLAPRDLELIPFDAYYGLLARVTPRLCERPRMAPT